MSPVQGFKWFLSTRRWLAVAAASLLRMRTLRSSRSSSEHCAGDGHAVFHAYDDLSATELAFAIDECHLVITNSRVGGLAGIDLVYELRARLPELPIVYLANLDRSTPASEAQLPNECPDHPRTVHG
jgi:hypothetical protein